MIEQERFAIIESKEDLRSWFRDIHRLTYCCNYYVKNHPDTHYSNTNLLEDIELELFDDLILVITTSSWSRSERKIIEWFYLAKDKTKFTAKKYKGLPIREVTFKFNKKNLSIDFCFSSGDFKWQNQRHPIDLNTTRRIMYFYNLDIDLRDCFFLMAKKAIEDSSVDIRDNYVLISTLYNLYKEEIDVNPMLLMHYYLLKIKYELICRDDKIKEEHAKRIEKAKKQIEREREIRESELACISECNRSRRKAKAPKEDYELHYRDTEYDRAVSNLSSNEVEYIASKVQTFESWDDVARSYINGKK